MSLKAKIEAVIYASEEPVTLAQLIGLLSEEGQVELEAFAAQQHSLALEDEADPGDTPSEPVEDADALNAEVLNTGDTTLAETATTLSSRPESAFFADGVERPAGEAATEPDAPGLASETQVESPEILEESPTPDAKAVAAAQKLRERKLRDYFRSLLDQLIADYANGDRGLEIREVAGGFRLGTKAEYHDAVRGFVKSLKPPLKLTLQALETLAVVAYKQPVTSPEVSEIRGVESAGTLGSLMTRKLVTTAGRKQVIGRPILYKTTKDFLLRFGLKDINELPSIEEFEKMAGELNETLLDQVPETVETETVYLEAANHKAEVQKPEVQEAIPMETPEHSKQEQLNKSPTPSDGGSPPIDEIHSFSDPTHVHHDTPEDLLSDKSTHPEGHKHEHADKTEVDPMAEQHSTQADGIPDEDA